MESVWTSTSGAVRPGGLHSLSAEENRMIASRPEAASLCAEKAVLPCGRQGRISTEKILRMIATCGGSTVVRRKGVIPPPVELEGMRKKLLQKAWSHIEAVTAQTVEKPRESMRGLGTTRMPIVAGGVNGDHGRGFFPGKIWRGRPWQWSLLPRPPACQKAFWTSSGATSKL